MKKVLLVMLLLTLVAVFAVSCGEEVVTTQNTSGEDTIMTTPKDSTLATPTETSATSVTTEPSAPKTYPLDGKTFMFLGSSVTYGSASGGTSFVEYIKLKGKCTVIKEAVSGTTLVDNSPDSYVQRLVNNLGTTHKDTKVDHLIVQLSTNDASQGKALGRVSEETDSSRFNTGTIIGAIEFIIAYAKETWGCHVSFYTGTKYESGLYEKMVEALYEVQKKWDIGILDLWNDEEMNAVSDADYKRYMSDSIHPTAIGYREWWTPKFIAHLEKYE